MEIKSTTEKNNNNSRENKTSLLRIIKLDVELRDGKFHKATELAQKLGKSKRTILRDIEDLRDVWHAPIESSKSGYRYTERSWFFPAIYLAESDMISIGILSKSFSIYEQTPLWEPLQDILDNVLSPHDNTTNIISEDNQNFAFKEYRIKENDWFDNRICISRKPQFRIDDAVWKTIIQSLRENICIQFDYTSTDGQSMKRTVESWQLCFCENRWYLYGRCIKKGTETTSDKRTYNLERISNASLDSRHFDLPDPSIYKKNEYSVGNFGISSTDKTEKYKIILKGYAANETLYTWSDDYKTYDYDSLPENEKIKDVDFGKGAKVIEFSSNQAPGVETFVYSFASNAIPLAPESLVKKWKNHLLKMSEIAAKL